MIYFVGEVIKNKKNYNMSKFKKFSEYDLDTLSGTAPKEFMSCRGKVLMDMYYEIKYNNTNYVTCVDEDIHSQTAEEFENMLISIIILNDRQPAGNNQFNKAQIVSSKIANLLGMKTAYITQDPTDSNKIISVDILKCIKDQESDELRIQKLLKFSDIDDSCYLNSKCYISEWLNFLEKIFNTKEFSAVSETRKKFIISEFVKMFVIRSLILKDRDMHSENICFVYSKHDYSDLELSAGFDYEYCLGNTSSVIDRYLTQPDNFLNLNIEYLVNNYPNEIAEIIQNISPTEELFNNISQIIRRNIKDDIVTQELYNTLLTNRITEVNRMYNYHCQKEYYKEDNLEKS